MGEDQPGMKTYYRMQLSGRRIPPIEIPAQVRVITYAPAVHHAIIPNIYAEAFDEPAWPSNWDQIPAFDPQGVFVAVTLPENKTVGFAISFQRAGFGYISVVAVIPTWRRKKIASAMIRQATENLYTRGLGAVQIDVEESNTGAQKAYEDLGFEVIRTFQD